ncbi:MAG: hypothetical protein NTV70_14080 [Acidobacteria bacterium]|nr:hypothetical protein [Acidobacteriota bacterium]
MQVHDFAPEIIAQAEARLKRHYQARRFFSVRNYRPPTGIGLFDFDFDASAGGSVDVTVKVAYQFLGHGVGPRRTYIDWTPQQMQEFKQEAARVCQEAWSNKYRFICTKPGWAHDAKVNISLQEVAPGQAHYIIECRNVPQDDSSAWSGGCTHGPTVWPYVANFSNWGVKPRRDFGGDKIYNFKERQLTDLLKSSQLAVVDFPADTETLGPTNPLTNRLYTLVDQMKQVLSNDFTGMTCRIFGLDRGRGLFGKSMGSTRARNLAQLLNTRLGGGRQFFVATEDSSVKQKAEAMLAQANKVKKDFEGVCLVLAKPADAAQRVVVTNYIVITHEFGHMLGCPDEYTGINCTGIKAAMGVEQILDDALMPIVNRRNLNPLGNDQHFLQETTTNGTPDPVARLQKQQTMFAYQIEQANVESPFFMGQNNALNFEALQEYDQNQRQWLAERDELRKVHARGSKQDKKHALLEPQMPPSVVGGTDSIMFTGQKILAAHYLPIWSCLTSATREYIDPSEWSIVAV